MLTCDPDDLLGNGQSPFKNVQAHDAHCRWAIAIVIRDRKPSHRADFYGIPENGSAKKQLGHTCLLDC